RLAAIHDHRLDLGRGPVRLVVTCVGSVGERVGAVGAVAVDPLVGGLARDAGAGGELRNGEGSLSVEGDELGSFEHGVGDGPGHGGRGEQIAVQREVSPISPVQSVTYQPGLYL